MLRRTGLRKCIRCGCNKLIYREINLRLGYDEGRTQHYKFPFVNEQNSATKSLYLNTPRCLAIGSFNSEHEAAATDDATTEEWFEPLFEAFTKIRAALLSLCNQTIALDDF